MILLTEKPLFMGCFFQISVTVFTFIILINVLRSPYFLKALHFVSKMKAFILL